MLSTTQAYTEEIKRIIEHDYKNHKIPVIITKPGIGTTNAAIESSGPNSCTVINTHGFNYYAQDVKNLFEKAENNPKTEPTLILTNILMQSDTKLKTIIELLKNKPKNIKVITTSYYPDDKQIFMADIFAIHDMREDTKDIL